MTALRHRKVYRTESRFRAALKKYDAEGLLSTWYFCEKRHAYVIYLRRPVLGGCRLAGLDAVRERLLSPEGFAEFMATAKKGNPA